MTTQALPRQARSYAYPEYQDYPDTGCHISPKCLTCPLVICIEDVPTTSAVYEVKRAEARRLRATTTMTVAAIAEHVGLSRRAVIRAGRA